MQPKRAAILARSARQFNVYARRLSVREFFVDPSAYSMLEHIERRVEFLRDVQSRLSPSRWLIRVPMFDRDWRPSLRKELGLFAYSDPTHYTEYTVESFRAEMREAGLGIRHLQVNWGEIWAEAAAGHAHD